MGETQFVATKWMTPTLLAAFVNIIRAIPYSAGRFINNKHGRNTHTSTNKFGKHEVAADSFTRGGAYTPRANAIVRPWTNGKLGAPRNIDHW
jgi:hypothetical protein